MAGPKEFDLERVISRIPKGSGLPLDVQAGAVSGPPPLPLGRSAAQELVIRALQLYLPEVYPIPGAVEFEVDTVAPSPGAGTIAPAALRFNIPDNAIGIVRVFGQGLDDMTNATRVTWGLFVNDHQAPGWGAVGLFPGVAARVTSSSDVFVRLPDGAIVSVRITNTDGAAYQVGANYSGWYWSITSDRAWRGELYRLAGLDPSTGAFG